MDKQKIYAHRGGAGYYAENTLAAFSFAIDQGCDGAELDVHLSKDGEVVVHHNASLNRKFCKKVDGSYIKKEEEISLRNLSLQQIREFTVGEPNPLVHNRKLWPNLLPTLGQKIPTLEEVIKLVKEKSDKFSLVIEIKTDIFCISEDEWIPLVVRVIEIIERFDFESRVAICGFNWNPLLYVKNKKPNIPLWFTTHPLSWYTDGDIPKSDIPPSRDYLSRFRYAWKNQSAHWLAGFQPDFIQDFPVQIKRAGGSAWFIYYTDAKIDNISVAYEADIKIGGWSVNSKNIRSYQDVNLLDYLCLDYPSLYRGGGDNSLKDVISFADGLRKEKKFSLAEKIYEKIINVYDGGVPCSAYVGLAISQRMLKKLPDSGRTISRGIMYYPNEASLLIEEAVLEATKGKWEKSLDLWKKISNLKSEFSALNYVRFLVSCERNWDWDLHLQVVLKALEKYPDNPNFEAKYILNKVAESFNKRDWQETISLIGILQNLQKNKGIKVNFLYFLEEAKFQIELAEKNLMEVDIPFQNNLYAQNFAGTLFFIEKARDFSSNKEKWSVILKYFKKIVEFSSTTDKNIKNIKDEAFCSHVKNFCKHAQFEENDTCSLPKNVWFIFANLFLLGGKYRKYNFAREQALKACMHRGNMLASKLCDDIDLFKWHDSALVEAEESKHRHYDLREHWRNSCKKELLSVYAGDLYFGDRDDFRNLSKEYYSENDKLFANYIKNKSVAIVGPVDTKLLNGPEIDEFDVVLRFNYCGLHGYDIEKFGSKTNMSFYVSLALTRNFSNIKISDYMNELDWIVFDYNQNERDACFSGVSKPMRMRYKAGHKSENPFFKGTPNAAQRALLDLLRFETSRIKLFNMNLFLDNNYSESYTTGREITVSRFNFTLHDPISNFEFVRRLYLNNVIEVDEVLSDILRMTKFDYIESISKRYESNLEGDDV